MLRAYTIGGTKFTSRMKLERPGFGDAGDTTDEGTDEEPPKRPKPGKSIARTAKADLVTSAARTEDEEARSQVQIQELLRRIKQLTAEAEKAEAAAEAQSKEMASLRGELRTLSSRSVGALSAVQVIRLRAEHDSETNALRARAKDQQAALAAAEVAAADSAARCASLERQQKEAAKVITRRDARLTQMHADYAAERVKQLDACAQLLAKLEDCMLLKKSMVESILASTHETEPRGALICRIVVQLEACRTEQSAFGSAAPAICERCSLPLDDEDSKTHQEAQTLEDTQSPASPVCRGSSPVLLSHYSADRYHEARGYIRECSEREDHDVYEVSRKRMRGLLAHFAPTAEPAPFEAFVNEMVSELALSQRDVGDWTDMHEELALAETRLKIQLEVERGRTENLTGRLADLTHAVRKRGREPEEPETRIARGRAVTIGRFMGPRNGETCAQECCDGPDEGGNAGRPGYFKVPSRPSAVLP
ncbi:hypothetical protein V8E36_007552 [Tilletia maclaganii]